MNRTEDDLRTALDELAHSADRHAPSTARVLERASLPPVADPDRARRGRIHRWVPPIAAAAVVAAAATTATLLGTDHVDGTGQGAAPRPSTVQSAAPTPTTSTRPADKAAAAAAAALSATAARTTLEQAASNLDVARWTTPAPDAFYYRRTTEATTWTSVSGRQPGRGRNAEGVPIDIPGCRHGQIVARGQSGSCTLRDVPHYLADAPTVPSKWAAYFEQIAPGATAADALGKITLGVLHEDLTAPKATAALLRFSESARGLHTFTVRPVDGEQLVGVTWPSLSEASYGLAFDRGTHSFVGFVGVTSNGTQDSAAEIVRTTAIVSKVGERP